MKNRFYLWSGLLLCVLFSLPAMAAPTSFHKDDEPNELSWQHFQNCRFCFEDFKAWWKELPLLRRQTVLQAAQRQGLLPATPRSHEVMWIQGEALHGPAWQVNTIVGRTALKGPLGHNTAIAQTVIDIPAEGEYRLWSRWWNLPGYHNSFAVNIRPIATKDFQYSWQGATQADYLNYRFAFAWHKRPNPAPVAYQAKLSGFQWESTQLFHLPKGQVVLQMTPTIHGAPYTYRNIDCFLLTSDPLYVPDARNVPDSRFGDPASLITTQQLPPAGTADDWQVWALRPAAVPPGQAPSPLADVWRDWRDQLIERLARGEGKTAHEKVLEQQFYFDEKWNLVGTPAQVREAIDRLQQQVASSALPLEEPLTPWLADGQVQWTGFNMTDWPQAARQLVNATPTWIEVQPGAVQCRVLHLTNRTEQPITISPQVVGDNSLLNWRVVAFQFQPRYGWQPMPLLRRRQVTIPPRLTASLWLNFDARNLSPGMRTVALDLGAQKVAFQMNVTGIDIRQAKVPLVGGWCAPWPGPEGWQTFADYGINIVHGPALSKAEMQRYRIALFDVKLGAPRSADEVHTVVKEMKAMGLDYTDWAWEIHDEPNQRSYPQWIAAAKIIRQADPQVRIWCNPGDVRLSTPEAVKAMSPWVDVFCPYTNQLVGTDGDYNRLTHSLGQVKLLYTTPCSKEKAPDAPLDYLKMADIALEHNRDGWDNFSLRAYYPYAASAWDEVNAMDPAQAVSIYPGAWEQVIGSRNLEAERQAIQKWKTTRQK